MYAGELTSRLSLHECISHVYLYCSICFYPFVDDWQKRGERFWVYICIFEFLHILSLCILCFIKLGECFWKFKQKGGEGFWEKDFGCLHVSLTLLMHIYLFYFMYFIEYLLVYCYAWVKGELLWSLTLIHAYNSMSFVIKKGEIVGPKAHHSSFDDD